MSLDFDAGGLKAILADPTGFGEDVAFGYHKFRGILSREQRMQDDGAGISAQVEVTTLLVQATKLPSGVKTDSRLLVGAAAYRVRRVGSIQSDGSRELIVVEDDA